MKAVTISPGHAGSAISLLRTAGHGSTADALQAVLEHRAGAIVLSDADPLLGPIRVADLDQAEKLAFDLGRARDALKDYEQLPATDATEIELVVFRPDPPTSRLLGLTVRDGVEQTALLEVVGNLLRRRVVALKTQLRDLGVDPDA